MRLFLINKNKLMYYHQVVVY